MVEKDAPCWILDRLFELVFEPAPALRDHVNGDLRYPPGRAETFPVLVRDDLTVEIRHARTGFCDLFLDDLVRLRRRHHVVADLPHHVRRADLLHGALLCLRSIILW